MIVWLESCLGRAWSKSDAIVGKQSQPQKPGPPTIDAAENTQVIIGLFYMGLMRGASRLHENVTPPQ